EIGNKILDEYKSIRSFGDIPSISFQKAAATELIAFIGNEVDESFLDNVMGTSVRDEQIDKSISIVYSPLNGAGSIPVQKVLAKRGFFNVHVVEEQEMPDGNFPTIDYPNPEDVKAFEYALAMAESVEAELLIATDPDCDRVATIVKHNESYIALTGNQVGVILINYILSSMREKNLIKPNSVIVKSIVTGEMGTAIAHDYGVEMISVLTGFKNICAISNEYELTGEKTYIMGFEESIGYNIGTFIRDKDGVSATMLLVEAAAFYKSKGCTFIDVLNELYNAYGYYNESTISIVLEGIEGQRRIGRMMEGYRKLYPMEIGKSKLVKIYDYSNLTGLNIETGESFEVDSETTNAVKYVFDDDSWYALRPSGTEPKIKIYVYSKADTQEESVEKIEAFKSVILEEINKID
ncbi:MAG: phospho-sugar mutase, partial [Filifactoraceae bacterium]